MTTNVRTIQEDMSLLEAALVLEAFDMTGVPVLSNNGSVSGFLSLRDIMKGRRAAQMNAPVKAYMTRNVIISDGSITMREVERIFYKHHIGHLPIVEHGELQGIVTRWDYLKYKKRQGSTDETGV
jgi:tRNA nucleotidyltransferase (CCA-adding enzyme)